ncbi:MAG: alpha/beta hydrolase [Tannerella sp.]|jgi:acetyl esterase/lipase|nr:alpha/beta hydrolase [Tannerella sp.]
MNKILIISAVIMIALGSVCAQKTVKLWDTKPPTSNGITQPENIDANHWITNVSEPSITIYPVSGSDNTAVIILPGGGYAGLASNHEGTLAAQWLNKQGITGIVLKYRMPNKHKEVPLDDVHQAFRYVRTHAAELGVNASKIGIMGSSAGGHLASTASTHYTTSGVSTRPDFAVLFYPVITMEEATHGGSRTNLLGDKPSQADIDFYSNEKHVNKNTPPTLLLLSDDDKVVLPENSLRYYKALKDNNVTASMYIFPVGGHGWGFGENFKYHRQMLDLMSEWLKGL